MPELVPPDPIKINGKSAKKVRTGTVTKCTETWNVLDNVRRYVLFGARRRYWFLEGGGLEPRSVLGNLSVRVNSCKPEAWEDASTIVHDGMNRAARTTR